MMTRLHHLHALRLKLIEMLALVQEMIEEDTIVKRDIPMQEDV